MVEFNQDGIFEPMPAWGCHHNWVAVGCQFKHWTSSVTTSDAPPYDADIMQKRRCMVCGGVEWKHVCSEP